MFFRVYISIAAVTAAYGFALTATHFCRRPKVSKTLRPSVRPLAKARCSLAPVLLRGPAAIGHPWPGAASPASMPGCPLRRTSTRPPEGAGRSKSKAEGELTLGLMSGEGRRRCFALRRSDACSRRRPDSRPFTHECTQPTAIVGTPSAASRLLQKIGVRFRFSPLIRSSVSSPSAFDLSAPSRGRAQVLRSGQPGMDAGLAAPGHGWPMAAGPRSRTGARAWRALASHRTKGARALGYLPLLQVTRRKGETNSSRYRRNGYVHQ